MNESIRRWQRRARRDVRYARWAHRRRLAEASARQDELLGPYEAIAPGVYRRSLFVRLERD